MYPSWRSCSQGGEILRMTGSSTRGVYLISPFHVRSHRLECSNLQMIGYLGFLIGLLLLGFPTMCSAWRGKVVNVTEGDLLVVAGPNQQEKIRLYGVACPEKGQPFYDKARLLTAHLTVEKTIEVTPLYRGADGSENALVRVDGVKDYLNLQLVAYGMAWVKSKECSAYLCSEWKAIEQLARMNTIGLWVEPLPTPPWEWKKQQRQKIEQRNRSRFEATPSEESE